MEAEPIIIIKANGEVEVGIGYTIFQLLEALDAARQGIGGVILRPKAPPEQPEVQEAV